MTSWRQEGDGSPEVKRYLSPNGPKRSIARNESVIAEGRCFLCDKQGHLKRDCPVKGKEDQFAKRFKPSNSVQATYSEESVADEGMVDQEKAQPQRVEDLMTRLRGMTVDEKDEVIDTLVCQENF